LVDFWSVHSVWFLIFLFFFPRLTLVFSHVATGGVFWWLGWVFAPRVLVAVLATSHYWHTNPILCVLAWLWALGGESAEKGAVAKKSSSRCSCCCGAGPAGKPDGALEKPNP
jgi:hypothetical protein